MPVKKVVKALKRISGRYEQYVGLLVGLELDCHPDSRYSHQSALSIEHTRSNKITTLWSLGRKEMWEAAEKTLVTVLVEPRTDERRQPFGEDFSWSD